ncbi:CoA pyrophosphatase [Rasiella rasia]|uniref:CoA pyrophosphatase n=1 Tax=Rasiella rasia TaxID=2744027 RepID=A0A6G6GHX0_9FLAO|nr:CoA pyrophosphatase [Rasiella rasia]QIE58124.1 CoA pyrophosphatase [Rasiella rasia]
MDFSEFNERIVKIEKMELPGEQFHLKMAPIERLLELKKLAREKNSAKKAAVLVLFYPSLTNETHFVLILRKTYKGVHSAQIGFPGGKWEEGDLNYKETALREAEEEVGMPANEVSVLKELTEIYIPPSNFFVQPYLGVTTKYPDFVAQEEEVEAILEVPLQEFLVDGARTTEILATSYAERIQVPAFLLQGHVVWGATAMMLNEVREMLKQLLS